MADSRKPSSQAVRVCRSAFLSSATFRENKWRLRQLHGLHHLLVDSRDELVSALHEDSGTPIDGWEREYALLLQDIARHYLNALHEQAGPPQQTFSGTAVVRTLPVGVSFILSISTNPFRYALAALAASIAASNAVILGTESKHSRFFAVLMKNAGQYLDSQAIHIISGLDLNDSIFSAVDHVFILDEDHRRYSAILSSPKATFHRIETGSTLAVIDHGRRKANTLTKTIYRGIAQTPTIAPERLTAVFIRSEEEQSFTKPFSAAFGNRSQKSGPELNKLMELGFVPSVGHIYQAKLSRLLQSSTQPEPTFSVAIEAARRGGVLLLLLYDSFEQILDAMASLEPPPLQVALLAPASQSSIAYFEKWGRPKVFSVDTIHSIIPPLAPSSAQASQSLFSPSIFGQSSIVISGKETSVPDLTSIIERNSKIVKAPPLNPNKTVEFFTWLNRVVIGLEITLGTLGVAGAWYAYKWAFSRHNAG